MRNRVIRKKECGMVIRIIFHLDIAAVCKFTGSILWNGAGEKRGLNLFFAYSYFYSDVRVHLYCSAVLLYGIEIRKVGNGSLGSWKVILGLTPVDIIGNRYMQRKGKYHNK